jgi:type II secretory pathway pseudopilin PulG
MRNKGFTLIELIFVFSIIALLTISGIAAFTGFNKTQVFQAAVDDVGAMLNTAKSRSLSQLKPDQCLTSTLQGYQVLITIPSGDYELDVVCGGNTYMIEKKKLPSGVTFVNGSVKQTVFAVSSGTVSSPGTITINGNNSNKMITIDATGNISVR